MPPVSRRPSSRGRGERGALLHRRPAGDAAPAGGRPPPAPLSNRVLDGPSSYSTTAPGHKGSASSTGPQFCTSADFELSPVAYKSAQDKSNWVTDVTPLTISGIPSATDSPDESDSKGKVNELKLVVDGSRPRSAIGQVRATRRCGTGSKNKGHLDRPDSASARIRRHRTSTNATPAENADGTEVVNSVSMLPSPLAGQPMASASKLTALTNTSRRAAQGPLGSVDTTSETVLLRRKLDAAEKAHNETRRRLRASEHREAEQQAAHIAAEKALREELQAEHEMAVAEELAAVRLLQTKLEALPEHHVLKRAEKAEKQMLEQSAAAKQQHSKLRAAAEGLRLDVKTLQAWRRQESGARAEEVSALQAELGDMAVELRTVRAERDEHMREAEELRRKVGRLRMAGAARQVAVERLADKHVADHAAGDGFAEAVKALATAEVEAHHDAGLAHISAGMSAAESAGMSSGFLKAVGVQRAVSAIHTKLSEHAKLAATAATEGGVLAAAEERWTAEQKSWERELAECQVELKHAKAEVLRLQVAATKRESAFERSEAARRRLIRAVAAAEEERKGLASVAQQVERHKRARAVAERQAAAAEAAAVAAGVSKHRASMMAITAAQPPKPQATQCAMDPGEQLSKHVSNTTTTVTSSPQRQQRRWEKMAADGSGVVDPRAGLQWASKAVTTGVQLAAAGLARELAEAVTDEVVNAALEAVAPRQVAARASELTAVRLIGATSLDLGFSSSSVVIPDGSGDRNLDAIAMAAATSVAIDSFAVVEVNGEWAGQTAVHRAQSNPMWQIDLELPVTRRFRINGTNILSVGVYDYVRDGAHRLLGRLDLVSPGITRLPFGAKAFPLQMPGKAIALHSNRSIGGQLCLRVCKAGEGSDAAEVEWLAQTRRLITSKHEAQFAKGTQTVPGLPPVPDKGLALSAAVADALRGEPELAEFEDDELLAPLLTRPLPGDDDTPASDLETPESESTCNHTRNCAAVSDGPQFEPGAPIAYSVLVVRATGVKRDAKDTGPVDGFVRVLVNGKVEGETVIIPRSSDPTFAIDVGRLDSSGSPVQNPGCGGDRSITLRGLRWVGNPTNRVAFECYDYTKPGPGRMVGSIKFRATGLLTTKVRNKSVSLPNGLPRPGRHTLQLMPPKPPACNVGTLEVIVSCVPRGFESGSLTRAELQQNVLGTRLRRLFCKQHRLLVKARLESAAWPETLKATVLRAERAEAANTATKRALESLTEQNAKSDAELQWLTKESERERTIAERTSGYLEEQLQEATHKTTKAERQAAAVTGALEDALDTAERERRTAERIASQIEATQATLTELQAEHFNALAALSAKKSKMCVIM